MTLNSSVTTPGLREQLLIFPFNGNGIEAVDCIDRDRFDHIGFVDDVVSGVQGSYGWPIMDRTAFARFPDARVLAVPGGPKSYLDRADVIAGLPIDAARLVSVIHPSASIGHSVSVGTNCLIMAGVVLTSNVTVGDHVCILPNTVIHHDCVVEDFALIGCNVAVSGRTSIGRNCYVGSGSNIVNDVEIGARSLIGMGSNVIRNVGRGCVVAGNPARRVTSRK